MPWVETTLRDVKQSIYSGLAKALVYDRWRDWKDYVERRKIKHYSTVQRNQEYGWRIINIYIPPRFLSNIICMYIVVLEGLAKVVRIWGGGRGLVA